MSRYERIAHFEAVLKLRDLRRRTKAKVATVIMLAAATVGVMVGCV